MLREVDKPRWIEIFFFSLLFWRKMIIIRCEGILKYTCNVKWYDENRKTGRVSSIIQVQRGRNRFQSRWGNLKSNSVETELEWTWIRTCNLNPSSGRSTPMRHTRNYFHLRGTAQVSGEDEGGGREARRGKALQLIGKWRKFYSRIRHTHTHKLSLRISRLHWT